MQGSLATSKRCSTRITTYIQADPQLLQGNRNERLDVDAAALELVFCMRRDEGADEVGARRELCGSRVLSGHDLTVETASLTLVRPVEELGHRFAVWQTRALDAQLVEELVA